jgi:putative heme iron utilization protein
MLASDEFDPIRSARRLIAEARSGALATLLPSGAPYASLVTVATMPDASPVLLLSRLARHTANIQGDPRVSLMIEERRVSDPLEGARISISGTIAVTTAPSAERRFLARHPSATGYAGFKDFSYWRIEVTGAHLVAGFGRIIDLRASDLTVEPALADVEADAIEHMNKDHVDAIDLYATKLLGAPHGPWRIASIDPDGCDLILGDKIRRLDFPQRVTNAGALRKMLGDLAQAARER